MDRRTELRKRLQMHKRDCAEIPPISIQEGERRDLQTKLLLLQLECEEWRFQIRNTFQMCETQRMEKKAGDVTLEYMRTTFNWEPYRDMLIRELDSKELTGIAFLKKIYNRTFDEQESENQKATI